MTLKAVSSIGGGTLNGVQAALGILGKSSTQSLPVRATLRQVMASPPTTAWSQTKTLTGQFWPSTNYSVATGNYTYLAQGPYFTYTRGGNISTDSVNYPACLFCKPKSVNYGAGSFFSNINCISFVHTGTRFEIYTGGYSQKILIKVDDQYISLTPQSMASDGNFYFGLVTFTNSARRRIEILMSDGVSNTFGGVWTDSNDSIEQAVVRGPRCIILGDSFVEGTGATALGASGFPIVFSDLMGWDDVWPSGLGSTGYLATSGNRGTYRSRLATDVIPFNPDIVMFTGSVNDAAYTPAQIAAEALLCFQQIQAALPNCLIICVSPFLVSGVAYAGSYLINSRPLLKAAVQSVGGFFIDLQQFPLPAHMTAQITTLATASSAGATSLSTTAALNKFCQYQFTDGSSFLVTNVSGTGPFSITIDKSTNAQSSGVTITQVGSCLWTGNGKVGSTTGFGNCDAIVSSDGIHPPQAGHEAIAEGIVRGFMYALYGR